MVNKLLQDHVVVENAIVLVIVPVRIHALVHTRNVAQVPSVGRQHLVKLVQNSQNSANILLRRLAHLGHNILSVRALFPLIVLLDHANAQRQLLESGVQVPQLVRVLKDGEKKQRRRVNKIQLENLKQNAL